MRKVLERVKQKDEFETEERDLLDKLERLDLSMPFTLRLSSPS